MQSLGNKKMWIVFNTQHSNFNDCPPKCMYTILYIVYLRWAVTIPCMFTAWNPFLHTKNLLIISRRSDDGNQCSVNGTNALGKFATLKESSLVWRISSSSIGKVILSRLPFRASTTHSVERGLGNPMDVRLEVSFGKNFQSCKHL